MKVNLTTDFPPNLMRREAIGLALLKTRDINLPGKSLLMTLTLSSSDLLSGVPPRLHQTSGWTHHKGRINHKISHLMCLFMVGPILMDLTTHHPCPSLILMTYWGEHFSYLWTRMGRERGLPFLNMLRISINNKSPEKISSDSSSRLMEINLMKLFHITNLWNIWRTTQTLAHWKMASTDSNASRTIEDHILPQTQSTREVATTY